MILIYITLVIIMYAFIGIVFLFFLIRYENKIDDFLENLFDKFERKARWHKLVK